MCWARKSVLVVQLNLLPMIHSDADSCFACLFQRAAICRSRAKHSRHCCICRNQLNGNGMIRRLDNGHLTHISMELVGFCKLTFYFISKVIESPLVRWSGKLCHPFLLAVFPHLMFRFDLWSARHWWHQKPLRSSSKKEVYDLCLATEPEILMQQWSGLWSWSRSHYQEKCWGFE